MTKRWLIHLAIATAAAMLLFACTGTTSVGDDDGPPPVVEEDHRADLMGFWESILELGTINVHSSVTLKESRFVALLGVYTPFGESNYRVSGSWSASDTEITLDWVERQTYAKKTATLSYSLDGIDLTVSGVEALLEGVDELPSDLSVVLGRQAPWTLADFVGQWTERWVWDIGSSRDFTLTYNANGTCSWEDLYRRPPGEDRPDNRVYLAGTCELDLDENFLYMSITTADVTYEREPLEGHTVRFAFARWEKGAHILVSYYREEQMYDPLAETWVDNPEVPYGDYWLWLLKE